ncbi:unnamed protein product (macronuclear) [Paramecium tetraurelia]|uniref:Cullin family profile domain-containing protein n=1 Tax=Paramecium tetraurelia TaxID=5888 RepID=A0DL54_PARTE|nr:uncharacterized protein GSPATT00018088001 [Paramecium tetraurelia]CAK83771.1 unnamed protein product [Paramecium tetraurelia]|eukprot:XP_001451168.1 hypothetical protein (macronuclear) [Paramecium tetraurelia strain d4-2]
MKPTAKVFEYLNKYNYYLPQNCEQVQKMFYEQMVQHLQLGDSFRNSFISQISQINQRAQKETEFRQLIRDTWFGFIQKTPIKDICELNLQEIKDVQEFILKVLLEPTMFDITFVDELLFNYEIYFNSVLTINVQQNKGLAQVVVRNRFRMTISKLICSKFILSLDEKYRQKVRSFLFDIYLKKVETLDQTVVIQTEFLTIQNFYKKMFDQLFDIQEAQGTFYNIMKKVIDIIVRELCNIVYSLEIFTQFYQLYIEKDKILFEKYDPKTNIDHNKLANEILQKYYEHGNLREAIRQVVYKLFQSQNIEYKKLLKELVQKDIYSRENEQWVVQILREFEQYQIQKNRKQPIENDFHTYLRLQGFTFRGEKRGELEYDHAKLSLIIHDQTNFTVTNKIMKQTKRFVSIKEAHHYIQSSLQNLNN